MRLFTSCLFLLGLTGVAAAGPVQAPPAKTTASEETQPPPSTPADAEPAVQPSLPRFNSTWRTCREDKDCIAIDTRCGWGCINGASEKPASAYYRQLAPLIECAATSGAKPAAICVKKECVCQR